MTLKTLAPLFNAFFDPESTPWVVNHLQQLARVVRCCQIFTELGRTRWYHKNETHFADYNDAIEMKMPEKATVLRVNSAWARWEWGLLNIST